MHYRERSAHSPASRAGSTASAAWSPAGLPIPLPSLSEGTIGAVSAWLKDQEPELSTRLDLARLLASEGANVVSYTTDADTLANVQEMLGHEMAERVNDVSYDTDDEDLDELNEILGRRVDDPDVMSAMYQDLRALGDRTSAQHAGASSRECTATVRRSISPRPCGQGLATASDDKSSFPSESYGKDLAHWFLTPMLSDDEQKWMSDHDMSSNAGAALLGFMMRDVDYSADFLTGAAGELDQLRTGVRWEPRLDGRQHLVRPHRHQSVQRERGRVVHRPDG